MIIFWWCQVVVTLNLFITYNVDADDYDIPNIIFIPVGLNGDTNVVTFRLAIEDYGYREVMLSNFCRLHALSYESYLVLMRHLDHQCSSYELWNRRNDTEDHHYDHGVISFPVYVADYQNHSRTIHFTLNVSDTFAHESSQPLSSSPPLSSIAAASTAYFIVDETVKAFCVRYYFNDLQCDHIYKEAIAKYVSSRTQGAVAVTDDGPTVGVVSIDYKADGNDEYEDASDESSSKSNNTDMANKQAIRPIYSNYFLPFPSSMLRYNHAVKAEVQRLFQPSIVDPLLLQAEEDVYSSIIADTRRKGNSRLLWYDRDRDDDDDDDASMRVVSKPTAVLCFLHSATMESGSYRILLDMLELITLSGLMDALDALYVLNYGHEVTADITSKYPSVTWFHLLNETSYFETPSIRIMHRVAQSLQHRGWEVNILYVHTKGASYRLVYDHIEDWRHLMTYFLIERYRDCLDFLSTLRYDAVGVNYSPVPTRHFSGNFWWTTTSYMSTLSELKYEESGKFEPEMWFLQHRKNEVDVRIYVMHSSGKTLEYLSICCDNLILVTSY